MFREYLYNVLNEAFLEKIFFTKKIDDSTDITYLKVTGILHRKMIITAHLP